MTCARFAAPALLAGALACGRAPPAAPSSPASALPALTDCAAPVEKSENFVAVSLSVARDPAGARWLRARFTPQRPGDHLYSVDLPAEGIDGAGRPTRLALAPDSLVKQGAKAQADRPVHEVSYAGFAKPFPVYPDGPVELRLPLAAPPAADAPATATVTYMACSSAGGCLPPVENLAIPITIPAACR